MSTQIKFPIQMETIQLDPNIITLTDTYKVTHWMQTPQKMTRAMAFYESRGGRYKQTLFFGLQAILKKYFVGKVVTEARIQEAKELFTDHLGNPKYFNEAGWRHILEKHDGRLPLEIKAVREGTKVGTSNVLITVTNTDPECAWLVGYVEGLLLHIWYSTTVATQSYYMKQTLLRHLEKSGTPELVDYKLHDFGFRGVSSVETAGIGGAAHLVNFKGTDTIEGLRVAKYFYHERMAGHSIAAAEHGTITPWGRNGEAEAYRNMLMQFPTGFVAVVSDSFNIYHACEEIWGTELRDEVLARDGVLVIRPDSGDPKTVLPKILEILGRKFGYTVNAKGYKVLHDKVRLIQGDGVNYQSLDEMIDAVEDAGWSVDNLAFGSGGGLLQEVNRDTQKFAAKTCAAEIDNVWYDVMKDPVTDPGKRSKAGRLVLVQRDGEYRTLREEEADGENELVRYFMDGDLYVDDTFEEIRQRAAA